jgi:ATP diphosphatase
MARLRAPDGCPWDRSQTFDSIRSYTLEETYEVLQAIGDRDWPGVREELGDLLLQVLFYAQMATEAGLFDIGEVMTGLAEKLVRRHPHVFEDASGQRLSPEQALGRWDAMKAAEKPGAGEGGARSKPVSSLGKIPRGLPAIVEAYKMSVRAAAQGFEWPDTEAVLSKLEEEIAELRAELKAPKAPPAAGDKPASAERAAGAGAPPPQAPGNLNARIEEEVGDMFFTVVNVARHLGVEPESALKRSNAKFRRRYDAMEEKLQAGGRTVAATDAAELDRQWNEVKRGEK